ncbi:DUF4129 domain-containing protein [Halosimplex sp. J119]
MTRSGYRTVLVALGVAAVALGGALFPATGFGSAPASETDLVGPAGSAPGDGPAGDSTPRSGDGTVVAGEGTAPDSSETGPDAGPTDASETVTLAPDTPATEGATSTPTATPNATSSPTPIPDGTPTPAGGGIDWNSIVSGAVLLFVTTVGVLVFGRTVQALLAARRGSDGGSSGSPGILGWLGGLGGASPTSIAARIPQFTMVALVGVSTGTARVLGTAGSIAGEVAGGLALVAGAGSRSLTSGLGRGLTGLFSLPSGPTFSLAGLFSGAGGSQSTSGSTDSPSADARSVTDVDPESESDDAIRSVEEAWEAFAEPLPASRPEARTPAEFARLGIEHGDPSEPVRQLTRVFRDVRYGGQPSSDERTRSAIEAVGDILAERGREGDR